MTDILTLRKFEGLSPFEIKDELIKLAKEESNGLNRRSSMPVAAIRIGLPPSRVKLSSCWASSR